MKNQAKKILIVDDKASIRSAMQNILVSLGLSDITQAVDGQEAWDILNKDLKTNGNLSYDLIISDMEMPKMSGLELLKKVRKNKKLKTAPFIMATTVTAKDIIIQTMRQGVQAYIIKPFDTDIVELKLKQAGIL